MKAVTQTLRSSVTVGMLAAAILIAMNEIDRLVEQVVGLNGHTHGISAVISPLAWSERSAWTDWSGASTFPGYFIALHTALDLLFILSYTVLGTRLLGRISRPARRAPSILFILLVTADLFEDALIVMDLCLASGPHLAVPAWLAGVTAAASLVKWGATLLFALFCFLSRIPGKQVRTFLADALRGLYGQRLVAIVVALVAIVSTVTRDGVLEQVSDAYRGWIGYTKTSDPIVNGGAFFAALIAFIITGLTLFLLTRQRSRQYATLTAGKNRDDGVPVPWLAFGIVVIAFAIVINVASGGTTVDWPVLWVFVGLVLAVPIASLVSGAIKFQYPPTLNTDLTRMAEPVRRAGNALIIVWVAAAALGLFRAFVGPLVLYTAGLDWGPRLPNVVGWVVGAIAFSLIVGVVGPSALNQVFRRYDARMDENVANQKPGDSATLATVLARVASTRDDPSRDTDRAVRAVLPIAVGLAVVVVLGYSVFPLQLAHAYGPITALVVLLGCWATILGSLIAWLGQRKPLEVFRLLRLRSTPVITMLIVIPLVVSQLGGGVPQLHAIRFGQESESIGRDPLSVAYSSWLLQQSCRFAVPKPSGEAVNVAPMLLIAAEGGGIRAATWTVDVVRELPRDGDCAAHSALLSSGVSGGSIGLTAFRQAANSESDPAQLNTTQLGGPGALAAAISGMLAGDLIGSVSGIRLPSTTDYSFDEWTWHDRTALQELTWNMDAPQFAQPYDLERESPTGFLVLNSTDSVSNCKVLVSQVDLNPTNDASALDDDEATADVPNCSGAGAEIADAIDLQDYVGPCLFDLNWSTAAELSARFPIVSAAGGISNASLNGCRTISPMQLVDGGYIDNSGLGTISDIAPQLLSLISATNAAANGADKPYVVPVVMFVSNDSGKDVTAALNTTRAEVLVPIAAKLSASAAQVTPAAWLTRLSAQLSSVCPATANQSDCHTALGGVQGLVPQSIAVVSPSTDPSVAVPLGWTLSAFSRTRLRVEAELQVSCTEQNSEAAPCLTNGEYGGLGGVLALFKNGSK